MFFERFRESAARLPAGLLRPGPAADPQAIAAAERALHAPLPAAYASFLRSFDGADLFHESVVIAGVGAQAPLSLRALNPIAPGPSGELAFAETAAGDRLVFAPRDQAGDANGEPAVIRVRAGSEERVRAGSGFARWLDATVAREQMLYGPDGEFAPEVFEPDGEEVVPRVALRQAERALRLDPESAEAHLDRGVALRRVGRGAEAAGEFARAAELDPRNPWLWFDLGRALLAGEPSRAADAFRRAAEIDAGPSGARMLAWASAAARAAGDDGAAAESRAAALARQPALVEDLQRAVAAARADGDDDAAEQALVLVDAVDPDLARAAPTSRAGAAPPANRPSVPARLRLPVLAARAEVTAPARPARPAPPARPRRPGRAGPPPAGGSRRGPRR
ncbi:MAG TPA: tetratricopeptide repeat protein [Polyangia bacterium]|nr:tetratricopeptide repeat protein [Polyangia bacterium]